MFHLERIGTLVAKVRALARASLRRSCIFCIDIALVDHKWMEIMAMCFSLQLPGAQPSFRSGGLVIP